MRRGENRRLCCAAAFLPHHGNHASLFASDRPHLLTFSPASLTTPLPLPLSLSFLCLTSCLAFAFLPLSSCSLHTSHIVYLPPLCLSAFHSQDQGWRRRKEGLFVCLGVFWFSWTLAWMGFWRKEGSCLVPFCRFFAFLPCLPSLCLSCGRLPLVPHSFCLSQASMPPTFPPYPSSPLGGCLEAVCFCLNTLCLSCLTVRLLPPFLHVHAALHSLSCHACPLLLSQTF